MWKNIKRNFAKPIFLGRKVWFLEDGTKGLRFSHADKRREIYRANNDHNGKKS